MSTGATDGAFLRTAGIPTYGVSGIFEDIDDIRAHGRDERLRVSAFYEANTLLPVRPRRRFVSVRDPIEKVAPLLRTERPDILVGYGGWIDLFF